MKKVIVWLDKNLEETILAVLLAIMACIMFVQICLRFFGKALIWPEELARDCFIYTAFLCIPMCIKNNKMLKVDFIVSMFPQRVRNVVTYIGDCLCFLIWFYLWIYSFNVIKLNLQVTTVSQTMGFNMLWIYAMPSVALGLATIRGIQFLYRRGRSLMSTTKKKEAEE